MAISLTAAGAVLLAGCGGGSAEDAKPEHRSFALDGRSLTIDSHDSDLVLVPADVKKVEVTRWFKGDVVLGDSPKASWMMKGDRLSLRTHCSGLVKTCDVKHRIKVPRGVAVSVRGDDGHVRATGFRDALTISTEDGQVTVKDTTGSLDLRSDDGGVHALGVRSKRISASSKDGAVKIEAAVVPDRVNVTTDDGAIAIGLPKGASYRVSTTSVDGSVDVAVPHDPSSPHRVTARTTDGKVSVRSAN
ncbi:DUF4097 family beta strand repeat protein [Streptomyces tsukubensis]|uniref:DUF4097 domain-containing protein n=2 Tax=Streptomyces tsukubensis TaxID=83656 RepID=A0A1V4A5M0_9ACTN|nr:hypothetical protein B1H18_20400 [Streptomyces tsukubensis]QFR97640.1 DUF4097 family beta strand repeat protein [Streptomyces tsukubensis]